GDDLRGRGRDLIEGDREAERRQRGDETRPGFFEAEREGSALLDLLGVTRRGLHLDRLELSEPRFRRERRQRDRPAPVDATSLEGDDPVLPGCVDLIVERDPRAPDPTLDIWSDVARDVSPAELLGWSVSDDGLSGFAGAIAVAEVEGCPQSSIYRIE